MDGKSLKFKLMENINEAAKNYASGWCDDDEKIRISTEIAFKAGATWKAKQFPLVSVSDAMPEDYPELIKKGNSYTHTHFVLVFSKDNFLGLTDRIYIESEKEWVWDYSKPDEILFWMPLKRKL